MVIFVTGGAGFIGGSVIRNFIEFTNHTVVNIDKLTYAGNLDSLVSISSSERYFFEQIDICDHDGMQELYERYQPDAIMNLAAESHVDRSIENPDSFIKTNIIGTYNLLQTSLAYFVSLSNEKKLSFRFHHISTDEVYGDLDINDLDALFTEETSYSPSSPYSASKASSDHLVRAWYRTYKLPILITNCSNNYGPYHFPEKLIPRIILNALDGKELPIFGNGLQIRDWLYVEDHARALTKVLLKGKVGSTYNIGGHNEMTNISVVKCICKILEKHAPNKPNGVRNYSDLIVYTDDRPGHDQRYAIDASKIKDELLWSPDETFESGIEKTILWYLNNKPWWKKIINKST